MAFICSEENRDIALYFTFGLIKKEVENRRKFIRPQKRGFAKESGILKTREHPQHLHPSKLAARIPLRRV